jgi:hypothetical protein
VTTYSFETPDDADRSFERVDAPTQPYVCSECDEQQCICDWYVPEPAPMVAPLDPWLDLLVNDDTLIPRIT